MTAERERIGTIGDVEARYDMADPAQAWEWICTNRVVRSPNGQRVRLVADPDEREGTTWIVYEERVA